MIQSIRKLKTSSQCCIRVTILNPLSHNPTSEPQSSIRATIFHLSFNPVLNLNVLLYHVSIDAIKKKDSSCTNFILVMEKIKEK